MRLRTKIAVGVLGVVLLAAGCFAGYIWAALHWSYSKGERSGYVQKFSNKGWLCKTWEGELTMMPVPGSIPEKFLFSVRDDDVAQRINSAMGKRVNLFYEQHKGLPGNFFGETEHFISNVKVLDQEVDDGNTQWPNRVRQR